MMPKGIGRRPHASLESVTKFSLIGPALAACALLAGCGAGDYATKPAAATSAETAVKIVEMTDSTFAPSTVHVKVGETVSFVDRDEIAHTATAEKIFDSGTLREGQRFALKATKPGTISYICSFHPGMTGTIDVSS
jgi:plastocyanin